MYENAALVGDIVVGEDTPCGLEFLLERKKDR